MKFQEVAQIFNEIEPISARLEITRLLSDLFRKADPEEAKIIAYLSLGELNPPYIGSQFNFAEKSAIKVIAKLFDLEDSQIKSQLKTVGDLGSIVEKGTWRKSSNLSIRDVYTRLNDIKNISGTGSQELKHETVFELLKDLDPISAKYVIRVLTSTLRLGFSDMTLLDSLSWMLTGDKSLRKDLESAYNYCADIGLIAYHVKKNGIEGAKKLEIHLGVPIRMAAAERLPNAQEVIEKIGYCIAQPKLDGFRLQVHIDNSAKESFIRLFSRNLLDMSHFFLNSIHSSSVSPEPTLAIV